MDKWLGNTTVVRIIALALGLLLWVVVHLDEQGPNTVTSGVQSQTISNVEITMVGFDEGSSHIKSIGTSEVLVRLSGKRSALQRVNPDKYRIILDLSGVSTGKHTLPLREDGFPSGVEVLEISPSSVTLDIEAMQKQEMPVTISMVGEPAEGFKTGQPIVEYGRVHVTLPESKLADLATVGAQIDIEGVEEAIKSKVRLTAYDKNGNEMEASISPAVVEVEIAVTRPFKTLPLQVIWTGQTPEGYSIASIKQSVEQVTVYGPQSILDELDFYDGITIDTGKMDSSRDITLDIPILEGIEQVEPKELKISVEVVPSAERTVSNIPITLTGVADDLTTTVIDPAGARLNLVLEGAPLLLSQIVLADLQAIADVSNLPLGKHTVPIVLNLPVFIKQSGNEILRATVEIVNPKLLEPAEGEGDGADVPPVDGEDGTDGGGPTPDIEPPPPPVDGTNGGAGNGAGTGGDAEGGGGGVGGDSDAGGNGTGVGGNNADGGSGTGEGGNGAGVGGDAGVGGEGVNSSSGNEIASVSSKGVNSASSSGSAGVGGDNVSSSGAGGGSGNTASNQAYADG